MIKTLNDEWNIHSKSMEDPYKHGINSKDLDVNILYLIYLDYRKIRQWRLPFSYSSR